MQTPLPRRSHDEGAHEQRGGIGIALLAWLLGVPLLIVLLLLLL